MSSETTQMTGEQLLLARIFDQIDTRTIEAELDRRALTGKQDRYHSVLDSLQPLRPRRVKCKPLMGTAA